MSASSQTRMTSSYTTTVSSAENEERPRMRTSPRVSGKKNHPERHGPVQQRQQQQQQYVPITKRESGAEREAVTPPFSTQHLLQPAPNSSGNKRAPPACPPVSRAPSSVSKCPWAVTLGTL